MTDTWKVEYEGWDAKEHPLQEALCTLGNGYFATRAALEQEKDNDYNYPGTYLAGGYNRRESKIQGKIIENEDFVNWPNWLYLTFRIGNGKWFSLDEVEILEYFTTLNLEEGILERKIKFRDDVNNETSLISRRIVSMADYHVAGIEWILIPENWSDTIIIRSGIDGDIINNNVARYRDLNQDHTDVIEQGELDGNKIFLTSESKQSKIKFTQAAFTKIYINDKHQNIKHTLVNEKRFIAGDYKIDCKKSQPIKVEKLVALYTSRDFAISDPLTEAKVKINRLTSFGDIERQHKMIWSQIWNYNDVVLESDDPVDQLVLRLHIFHLHQTISNNSIGYDIGVPARGWHGEAYRGHVFWDEIYIQPFINLHNPQLSRSLLMYRFRRLNEAYHAAEEAGYRGALFPWQSGSNGREETQKIHLNPKSGRWLPDVTHLQYHINGAIPYNVWHYYQSTNDMDFLESHGAEIIAATALFWSSIAHYNEKRDRYEIHKVVGPDEYHTYYPGNDEPGLNNNAYTNVMAVWVIQRALDMIDLFDEFFFKELMDKIGITDEDIKKWKDITNKMYVPFKGDVIMQFEGYDELKELDWDTFKKKYGEAMRLDRILESEDDSANNYKASKQADVLMLFYIFSYEELFNLLLKLGYTFMRKHIRDNIDYYYGRTSHGSTLSQVIHSWVYARYYRKQVSWMSFKAALMSDFKDVQGGTTHEGIHLGAMAGTLDLVQRCYSGLEINDDILWLNPRLPENIKKMTFNIRYRSHWIKLVVNHEKVIVEFDKGWAEPVYIAVKGRKQRFETDDKKEFPL